MYIFYFIYLLGFTAQRLKICRTPVPTACLKMLTGKHISGRRKIHRQPRTYSHLIYTQMFTGVCQTIRMFSLCFFHVLVSTGILDSDLLSLSTPVIPNGYYVANLQANHNGTLADQIPIITTCHASESNYIFSKYKKKRPIKMYCNIYHVTRHPQ